MLSPNAIDFNQFRLNDYVVNFALDENDTINSIEIYSPEPRELLLKRPIKWLPRSGREYECFHDGKRVYMILSRGTTRGEIAINQMIIEETE